jgi:membrane protease YdiL (CAAX protease family)
MTASGRLAPPVAFAGPSRLIAQPRVRAALLVGVLAALFGARWAATVGALADGLTVGAAFGVTLVGSSVVAGWGPRPLPRWRLVAGAAIGLAGGLALVALAMASRWPGPWLPFDPAGSFLPWATVTVLVATGEELILRGALFDAFDEASGTVTALLVTSAAFAILHVPLYGWHVLPLDFGVGLFLGGLRLLTGGTFAPAVAHAVADLATWWI